MYSFALGGPEYEAPAGGQTKNLKIVPRKQNNPSFPSYFWICNHEEASVLAVLPWFLIYWKNLC